MKHQIILNLDKEHYELFQLIKKRIGCSNSSLSNRIFLDYFVGNIKQAYILTQYQDYAQKLVDSYDVN